MEGFIAATCIVLTCCLLVFLMVRAFESESIYNLWSLAGLSVLIAILALMINAWLAEERRGPCLKYETTMQYNAATKTTMPARYCALRGEWEVTRDE